MNSMTSSQRTMLFWACFVALVATAFAFMLRMMIMPEWEAAFGLDKTQVGTIFGAGLWPFGVSIVLFSLIIDKVGYGKAMIFAFASESCASVVLWMLSMMSAVSFFSPSEVISSAKPA